MRIAVSGASGLVGRRLVAFLQKHGHQVLRLVRGGGEGIQWDPTCGQIDSAALEDVEAVVHLAGENIAAHRWTDSFKAKVRDSRVLGTRLLSETLARLRKPPAVMVSASAIGYYGARDGGVHENDAPGQGFLSEVCQEWEASAEPARQAGIRVVHPRIGMVLAADGGALGHMLLPFRLGLGGVVGSGSQIISWIDIDDLVRAILHMITSNLSGPVNAVSPFPVCNAEFTRTLGKVLRRPTIFPLPTPLVRLLFGEMGQALLLEGASVLPMMLLASRFEFAYPELENALRHELT